MGAPDLETSLKQTKEIYADPLFSEFNKKVSKLRTLKGTYFMQRLIDFN